MAATGLTGDSADQPALDTTISQAIAAPVPVLQAAAPDRSLFATDVSRQIAAQSSAVAPAGSGTIGSGTVENGGRMQNVLKRALALLGTPYRWGGTSTEGFDCSGLVGYVFRSALGIELPRVSREMATSGEKIDRDSLSVGDLVFFSRRGRRVDHVGIYVGNGNFVHAPRTGKDVTISSLTEGYWSRKFMQARRISGI